MAKKITYFLFFVVTYVFAQQPDYVAPYSHFVTPEFLIGNPIPPTEFFPEADLGKAYFFNIGRFYDNKDPEWAYRTGYARTGISLGVTNYGNKKDLGRSYTFMPFTEFNLFGLKRLKVFAGIGTSHFTEKYQKRLNPLNDAITTDFVWSFKLFIHFSILKNDSFAWNIGGGYFHHSNGHTKLPNLGLNSLLASTSFEFNHGKNDRTPPEDYVPKKYKRTIQNYFQLRRGFGVNSLSEEFNEKKLVSTTHITFGKIYNRTFKFGVGFYYRHYEHYFDYIKNNEELIRELYPYFLEDPKAYAKNYGFSFDTEVLMNHIGLECNIGFNIYKPFYKVDKMVSASYTYIVQTGSGPVAIFEYGELDGAYEIKRSISTRLGLKYYLLPTKEDPQHNLFFGATINSNAGQADFSEFSVGYVYRYNFKERGKKEDELVPFTD